MKLIYAPPSPFARKVRIAAIELGLSDQIELEYAEVAPGRENAAYAHRINPLRKIPALIVDEATVLVDSTVICDYLDAMAGGGRIIPASGAERWRVLTQHAVAQGMCEAMVLVRYEEWLRPEALRWPAWTADQRGKARDGLAWFEARAATVLRKTELLDLSLITLASFLGYLDFRFPDTAWATEAPVVAAWYHDIGSRPSIAETLPTMPPEG